MQCLHFSGQVRFCLICESINSPAFFIGWKAYTLDHLCNVPETAAVKQEAPAEQLLQASALTGGMKAEATVIANDEGG